MSGGAPDRYGIRDAAIVSESFAAIAAVALPLPTFLRNSEVYPFSAGRLVPELLAWAAVLAGVCLPAARRVRGAALLAALSACVCLEAGPLSAGLPELNGGFVSELSNVGRACLDAAVWTAVAAGFVVFARKLKPWLPLVSLAVAALSLASLVDVVLTKPRETSVERAGRGFESQPTVVANVAYSPTRDVLVFVLDSAPALEASDVMRTNAALRAAFAGFTAYPRNVAMHECTKRGVPGLATGRYYDPAEMPEAEYPMTMYGTNSVVAAADAADWSVAFSPDLMPYGFTNLPVERRVSREERPRKRDALAVLRQSREVPYLSLLDLVAFRAAPFGVKGRLLYSRTRHAVGGRHERDAFWQESTMYPALGTRPVSEDPRPFLGFFHSWGVHPPWSGSLESVLTAKLTALARLMDDYRRTGIYDRSLIVVTSDHGLGFARAHEGYPPSASALLWVKPEGARGPFAESATPTSHSRIAPLVRAALTGPVTDAEKELRDGRRLYRAQVREGGGRIFRDWEAGDGGTK